jgi:hypothetical protein
VLISPDNPKYVLESERRGKVISLKNSGNSYVVLTGGKQCPSVSSKKEECFIIPSKRLYSGNRHTIELPLFVPAEISVQGVDGIQKKMTL